MCPCIVKRSTIVSSKRAVALKAENEARDGQTIFRGRQVATKQRTGEKAEWVSLGRRSRRKAT
jgi:hypothetical protein